MYSRVSFHRAYARELAALYYERWDIETALDELKTHLRGAQIVLRSKTPEHTDWITVNIAAQQLVVTVVTAGNWPR